MAKVLQNQVVSQFENKSLPAELRDKGATHVP
jgi:hypothetical protein